jgi:hypothetical protein
MVEKTHWAIKKTLATLGSQRQSKKTNKATQQRKMNN